MPPNVSCWIQVQQTGPGSCLACAECCQAGSLLCKGQPTPPQAPTVRQLPPTYVRCSGKQRRPQVWADGSSHGARASQCGIPDTGICIRTERLQRAETPLQQRADSNHMMLQLSAVQDGSA